jgi:tRNA G37 N-methylase TrmD
MVNPNILRGKKVKQALPKNCISCKHSEILEWRTRQDISRCKKSNETVYHFFDTCMLHEKSPKPKPITPKRLTELINHIP